MQPGRPPANAARLSEWRIERSAVASPEVPLPGLAVPAASAHASLSVRIREGVSNDHTGSTR